jgi:hypothetical protein
MLDGDGKRSGEKGDGTGAMSRSEFGKFELSGWDVGWGRWDERGVGQWDG